MSWPAEEPSGTPCATSSGRNMGENVRANSCQGQRDRVPIGTNEETACILTALLYCPELLNHASKWPCLFTKVSFMRVWVEEFPNNRKRTEYKTSSEVRVYVCIQLQYSHDFKKKQTKKLFGVVNTTHHIQVIFAHWIVSKALCTQVGWKWILDLTLHPLSSVQV